VEQIAEGELDVAIVTHVREIGPAEVLRREPLLWVGSLRHAAHELKPLPLALGRPTCTWRAAALAALEAANIPSRLLFESWSATAVGAAVLAGLAITILPESALRSGMRILGEANGLPPLPVCEIGIIRSRARPTPVIEALTGHIVDSLDNLSHAFAAE
jgi:DNA-binding transcriptional LysR family regulator